MGSILISQPFFQLPMQQMRHPSIPLLWVTAVFHGHFFVSSSQPIISVVLRWVFEKGKNCGEKIQKHFIVVVLIHQYNLGSTYCVRTYVINRCHYRHKTAINKVEFLTPPPKQSKGRRMVNFLNGPKERRSHHLPTFANNLLNEGKVKRRF